MGVAALILGVISIILSFIPIVRIIAFLPALVSIILGIVELASKRKNKRKSDSIVGIVLSGIAVLVMIFHFVVGIFFGIIASGSIIENMFNDITDELKHPYIYEEHYRNNYDFRYNDKYNEFEEFDSIYYNNLI